MYLLLFYKPIRGSSGDMHLCMFFHGWCVAPTVYIFILQLSARPFLVLVSEADYTPICLHLPSGTSGIFPFGFLN